MTDNIDKSRTAPWRSELRSAINARKRAEIPRVVMPELDGPERIGSFQEVNRGITAHQAVLEATRCLDCPDAPCVKGCPVGISIPDFIKNVQRGELAEAATIIRCSSSLPAVCGRVCPQERQCEGRCTYLRMNKSAVAIGYLERYVADNAPVVETSSSVSPGAKRIAVVGSGPASLSFAGRMASLGYDVTVYEALHQIGGVLKYGIPEFRLPNAVVDSEINRLQAAGVHFVKDCVIGATLSFDDLTAMGYSGVFVASGAGLPRFMGIDGENLPGVMSSNEYLTRINLMGAGRDGCDTPVMRGSTVVVIGGGNTAMDSVRTARRMGALRAILVYRRSESEMPARAEEIAHAKAEGVEFMTLHNPIRYESGADGRLARVVLQRMALGEPDSSGRRSPIPVEGEEICIDAQVAVVSVGVSPNPLVPNALRALDVSRRGTIVVDEHTMQSSIPTLFAGGDIVRGGATVILAMGDGLRAANGMHDYLSNANSGLEK